MAGRNLNRGPSRRGADRLRGSGRTNPSVGFRVSDYRRSTGELLPAITVSIGIAQFRPGESMAQLIERCDGALYLAKRTAETVLSRRTDSKGRSA